MRAFTASLLLAGCLSGCGGGESAATPSDSLSSDTSTSGSMETTNSTAGVKCDAAHNVFNNSASVQAQSYATWSCGVTERSLVANGIPDHGVGAFPNIDNPDPIAAKDVNFSVTLSPAFVAGSGTSVKIAGYAMNGVKFDPNTGGACDDSGTDCSLVEGRGRWRMEALGQSAFNFGTDENNAHVQPGGAYHYHGMPEGYIKAHETTGEMLLVGFASDGFPIYARYGHSKASDASSALAVMQGSYQLKRTPDNGRPSVNLYPMGTFRQDYAYAAGSGDLDECNGRVGVTPEFPQGIYHYYITDSYPYVQRCVHGTASASANEAGGAPPGGMPPGGTG